jgi:hypothetical protein
MKRLEVVLALDNTGSMARAGKMDELKKASLSLLDILKKAEKKKDDIKVAIVPFDYTVNVGTQADDAHWIRWLIPRRDWQGCVGDRDQPFDVQDAGPSPVDLLSLFPAVECPNRSPAAQLMPLTSNWSDLKRKINEMKPSGNTNITIGLVWAWHALTKSAPLNEAKTPKFNLEKAIILLTDGLNTENREVGPAGNDPTKIARIDARTRLACENVRRANINVYTVRVIEGNIDLLRTCATQPDMFYDVQDATQLNIVFESIAAKLAKLHIAK